VPVVRNGEDRYESSVAERPRLLQCVVPLLSVLVLGGFADGHLAAAQKGVMAFSSVEEQVNQYSSSWQTDPNVAHLDDDVYGIFWSGLQRDAARPGLEGIHGRQFTRDGIAKNELESLVDTSNRHSNIGPSVARVAPTTFAVTWLEFNESDRPDDTLFLRLVDDQEVPIGDDWEFADGLAVPDYWQNAGSTFPDGLVVAWTRSVDSQVTADASVVLTRRFDATGAAATEEIEVTSIADSQPTRAQVAGLLDRSWVVVWMELFVDTPDSDGVLLRRYAADGTPLGDAEVVNSHTAGAQRYPSVASFADGRFLVAWESLGQDGSDWGIFAQRYDASAAKGG